MASTGYQERINFASNKNQLEYPDFLDIQLKSFNDFFNINTTPDQRKNEGLYEVFNENFPISDTRNNFVLEFLDYNIDPPRYTIEECIERGLTYSIPLKAKLKLYCTDPEHEDFDTVVQDVYLGTIPEGNGDPTPLRVSEVNRILGKVDELRDTDEENTNPFGCWRSC